MREHEFVTLLTYVFFGICVLTNILMSHARAILIIVMTFCRIQ